MGAFTFPVFTSSLNARPAFSLSPCPIQQMRAGNPWKAIFCCAIFIQRIMPSLCGNNFIITSSVTAMSLGSPLSAAQRKGPLPSQNNGRMYSGTNPGKSKQRPSCELSVRSSLFVFLSSCTDVVSVIKGDGAFVHELQHELNMEVHAFISKLN